MVDLMYVNSPSLTWALRQVGKDILLTYFCHIEFTFDICLDEVDKLQGFEVTP